MRPPNRKCEHFVRLSNIRYGPILGHRLTDNLKLVELPSKACGLKSLLPRIGPLDGTCRLP
jgi:hypothetical protein